MLRNKVPRAKAYCALFFTLLFFVCLTSNFAQEKQVVKKSRRDPFMPLVTPDGRLLKLESEEGEQGVSLEGIIYDKNGFSYALVNGEAARIGDKIGEFQVFKILEDRVIFLKDGQPIEVWLKEGEE